MKLLDKTFLLTATLLLMVVCLPAAEPSGNAAPNAPASHVAIATARDFFAAVGASDFERAGKLFVAERYPKEKLQKLRASLRIEDAKLREAYVGDEQVAFITTEIAPRQEGGGRTGRWGISLRKQGDGWLIRDMDFLPNADAVQNYLAGFLKAEPGARKVALTP